MSSNKTSTRRYRITGPQSVDRLEPLVHQCGEFVVCTDPDEATNSQMDFVWETYCEKVWKKVHDSAQVLNRLHNTQVLEDKANLAFLHLRMKVPTLDTYIAPNATNVLQWCTSRWSEQSNIEEACDERHRTPSTEFDYKASLSPKSFLNEEHHWSVPFTEKSDGGEHVMPLTDWWAVKASKGNGGKDVWVVNRRNFEQILSTIPPNDEYIIQRYIPRPLLWHRKKFHFRCYSLLRADMSAFVYEKAFIICAGLPYDLSGSEPSCLPNFNRHLTNLAINKSIAGHPGQVPCLMSLECPTIFQKICDIWSDTTQAAAPFMQVQRNANHFDFFGIDIIADANGDCWLIEVNRLPGLESSNNRCKQQEDDMYDEMMLSTLRMVLTPLDENVEVDIERTDDLSSEIKPGFEKSMGTECAATHEKSVFTFPNSLSNSTSFGLWKKVCDSYSASDTSSGATFKNLFNWKAFTSKNKKSLLI